MNTPPSSTAFRVFGFFVTLIVTPMLLWLTKSQTAVYQTLVEDMYGSKDLLPPEVRTIIRINLSETVHWSLIGLIFLSAFMLWQLRRPAATAVLCSITLLAASVQLGLSGYFCSHFIETQVRVLEVKLKKAEKNAQ